MRIKRKKELIYKILIIALPLLSILGIYLLTSTGKSDKEIIDVFLQNLFLAPIEILATTFIIGAIVKKSEERSIIYRNHSEYFEIAKDRQDVLIRTMKEQLAEVYIGNINSDIDKQINDIKENIEKYINGKKVISGYSKPFVDTTDIESLIKIISFKEEPKIKSMSIFEASGLAGLSVHEQIKGFLELYLRFIPVDIFQEIDAINQLINNNVLFSPNKNYIFTRQFLTERTLKDEELKNLVEEYRKIFIEFIEHIDKIEQITKQHYKDLK